MIKKLSDHIYVKGPELGFRAIELGAHKFFFIKYEPNIPIHPAMSN